MKFRKKPIVIEAIQWTGNDSVGVMCNEWGMEFEGLTFYDGEELTIRTLESNEHRVGPGDWVIRGIKGEFYACKPDIFEATYDLAQPGPSASKDAGGGGENA